MRFLLTFLTFLAIGLFVAICYVFYDTKTLQITQNTSIKKESKDFKEIKFSDLPPDIQKNYINKKDLSEYGDYITPYSYALNFEINSNDGEVVGNTDELKTQIISLRNHNKLLYIDNIDLANKNWEAIIRLRDQKKDIEKEKKEFLDKNLKLMKEAQNQHYKNIDKLTKRLKDVELNNIENSKIYEQKIVKLKNEIDTAQKILQNKELEFNEKLTNIMNQEKQNNLSINEKNSYLLGQLEEIKAKNSENLKNIEEQKKEINRQKSEFNHILEDKNSQINSILSKHAIEIANLENKNKFALLDARNEFKKQEKILTKDLELKEEEIKNFRKNALEERQSYTNQILRLEDKLAKTLALNKNLQDKNAQKNHFKILNEQNLTIVNLKNELKALKDKNESKIISDLKNELKTLKQNNTAKALNSNLVLNYGIKARDYEEKIKILNEKLNDIRDEKQDFAEIKKENSKLKSQLAGFVKSKNENFKIEVIKNDEEILTLKDKNNKLSSQITKLKNQLLNSEKLLLDVVNENEKLKINRISNAQTNDIIEKYEKSLQNIKELEIQNSKLRHEILNLDKKSIESIAPKKVVYIDSISCEDLNSKNKPSVMCKNLVSEFLQKYNSNFSFCVVAINNSNSVKNLSKKLKNSLNNAEKFTNYAMAHEKAEVGANLIRNEFGDFSRISYSNEIITKPNKQGFIIKVYR